MTHSMTRRRDDDLPKPGNARAAFFVLIVAALALAQPLSAVADDAAGSSATSTPSAAVSSGGVSGPGPITTTPGAPLAQLDIGGYVNCNDSKGAQATCYVIKDWPDPTAPVLVDNVTGARVPWSAIPQIWSAIAKNYDTVAFNALSTQNGDDALFFTVPNSTGVNYPSGMNQVGIYSFFSPLPSDRAHRTPEGLTTLGAIVGGTLGGVDYSNKVVPGYDNDQPSNLVLLGKKWFSSATGEGANVFLDNARLPGGKSFWYDIISNIFACQLAGLYGSKADAGGPAGEPSLSSLCLTSVGTWNAITDNLAGGSTTAIPEFAYTAVQMVADAKVVTTISNAKTSAALHEPIETCLAAPTAKSFAPWNSPLVNWSFNPKGPYACTYSATNPNLTHYQSDSAAGLAYLNFIAYENTGNSTYLSYVKRDLGFLDSIQYNPFWEILLPYGVIAGARMNAEYGATFDIGKYLDWSFSNSAVRMPGSAAWSMYSENWAGYPMYGLVGGVDYSILFSTTLLKGQITGTEEPVDTVTVAQDIVPVARYQPQYAQAIGKYLAQVATNGLISYPEYIPYADPTTTDYINSAGTVTHNGTAYNFSSLLQNSIPFEWIEGGRRIPNQPFGTGSVFVSRFNPLYRTNLATYMGINAGAMAALLHGTNVPGVYQIDLLATDLPRPNAYPTYLFYNPLSQTQTVAIDIGLARAKDSRLGAGPVILYDLVSKQILSKSASGAAATFSLAHDQARVIAVVPASAGLQDDQSSGELTARSVVVDYYYTRRPDPRTEAPAIPPTPSHAMAP